MRVLLWLLKKYNYVLVFIFLEVLALFLLSNNNSYQRSVLVNLHREVSGAMFDLADGTREYISLRQANEVLVNENTRLRNKIEKLTLVKFDSVSIADSSFISLDSLITTTGKLPADSISDYLYTEAKIVRSTYHKQFNYLTINKGEKHGISADMAVISDEGIAGIVLESSQNFSTVIPVINRDFRLSVKLANSNYAGILQWEGNNHLLASMNEIPYHAEVGVGDSILTSGFSAIFPEGLFVGTVKDYSIREGNFYKINVDLGTNYQRLFYVNVINNNNQEEQRKLESNLK